MPCGERRFIRKGFVANPKIKLLWNSVVQEIKGNKTVQSILVKNVKTNEVKEFETEGVFVFVGTFAEDSILKRVWLNWMRRVTSSPMRSARPQSKESLLPGIAGNSCCVKSQPLSAMEQLQHLRWRNILREKSNSESSKFKAESSKR